MCLGIHSILEWTKKGGKGKLTNIQGNENKYQWKAHKKKSQATMMETIISDNKPKQISYGSPPPPFLSTLLLKTTTTTI